MNILVVDDAIVARKMIKRHLTGSPYENAQLIEATSGEQGLELFDKTINLIMSDWNMPGINGLEFAAEVRQREKAWLADLPGPVPIIMITTEGTIQKINQAREVGIDEYIVKPFSPAQLINAIARVLED